MAKEILSLHEAVRDGNYALTKRLLINGESPNSVDENGETPLIIASNLLRDRFIELLLLNDADINKERKFDGNTPLHEVSKNGGLSTAKLLVEVNPNRWTTRGEN